MYVKKDTMNCPYVNCSYNCKDIREHRILYAKIRTGFRKSNFKEKPVERIRSSKVNWDVVEKLNLNIY